ncbi:hypothetical protein L3Q82_009704 [Scortum barcoo]|uniref:Uncharacterized protein n=1 Tax=Scortum barcoo TaxID=214431 RepID=A0ACB8WDW2_9TELE|nr:hypothetical protein L3Q82_009704 [Scortum barcoo]
MIQRRHGRRSSGGAFLQRGWDDCTILRRGWMGPCIA